MLEEKINRYVSLATELDNVIKDIESTYNYNFNEASRLDRKTQDLLHKLELDELTEEQQLALAQDLIQTRQQRREYKDTYEVLGKLNYHINYGSNKAVIDRLINELRLTKKTFNGLEERTYVERYKGV